MIKTRYIKNIEFKPRYEKDIALNSMVTKYLISQYLKNTIFHIVGLFFIFITAKCLDHIFTVI